MQVIEETNLVHGVSVFHFSDNSSISAVQRHDMFRSPFVTETSVTLQQRKAIRDWTACEVIDAYCN